MSSASGRDMAPVVFVPGFMGTRLYANVTDDIYMPTSCKDENVSVGVPFAIMFNVSLDLTATSCVFELLTLVFDPSAEEFVDQPGIVIFTQNFGGFSDISPVYWAFANTLVQKWTTEGPSGGGGEAVYALGRNLFGAPYDYRFMSVGALRRTGFVRELVCLVERAFVLNNGTRVVLVGHSNGGPTLYSFLRDSNLVSASWKDKYIAAFIPLSGNLLGQMNAIKPFLYNTAHSFEGQLMLCSWEGTFGSTAWGGYTENQSSGPVVTTFLGSPQETNYTTSLEDMGRLFATIGRDDWTQQLASVTRQVMNRSAHPGVDVVCLFGTDVSTEFSYGFAAGINDYSSNQPHSLPVIVRSMGGDGNQDIVDNEFCLQWADDNDVGTQGFRFDSEGFPGVHHMEMYNDDAVMSRLYSTIWTYSYNQKD